MKTHEICNANKKRLQYRRFSVNFAEFLRTLFDGTPPAHSQAHSQV